MAPWGLIAFLVGLAYGWIAAGKQDKSELLKRGLLIGVVVAIVLAVAGWLTDAPALGVGGTFAVIWTAFVLALLFILGVWIGDLLEGRKRTKRPVRD